MVRTGTRSLEEEDGAKEDPVSVAVAIAVTVAETTRLQNIHLKEKWKASQQKKAGIADEESRIAKLINHSKRKKLKKQQHKNKIGQ